MANTPNKIDEILTDLKCAVERGDKNALRQGQLLAEAKRILHRNMGRWVRKHFGYGPEWASRLISLYKASASGELNRAKAWATKKKITSAGGVRGQLEILAAYRSRKEPKKPDAKVDQESAAEDKEVLGEVPSPIDIEAITHGAMKVIKELPPESRRHVRPVYKNLLQRLETFNEWLLKVQNRPAKPPRIPEDLKF